MKELNARMAPDYGRTDNLRRPLSGKKHVAKHPTSQKPDMGELEQTQRFTWQYGDVRFPLENEN